MSAARLTVELGPRSYDILVGAGLLAEAGSLLRPILRQPRVVIVTDAALAATPHPARLEASLAAAGIAHHRLQLPAGEATKSIARLEQLLNELLALGIERRTAVLALGGGVIGDLAGFAAAITLRGLDFVQLPTTLLAQVDSAVGGKTGINLPAGKNLVGAFHQPRLVLADSDVLATLPARELRAGYAEVVKYGLIDRPEFFAWLEEHGQEVLAGEPSALRHAVLESCRAKAAIVAADEHEEHGRRALLNLGHTFGHAFEALAGYDGTLLHGEGVAIGMVMAFRLSVRLGLCPAGDAERVAAHLAGAGLPTSPRRLGNLAPPSAVLAAMRLDKKVEDGRPRFVLARGIGQAFSGAAVAPADVLAVLEAAA